MRVRRQTPERRKPDKFFGLKVMVTILGATAISTWGAMTYGGMAGFAFGFIALSVMMLVFGLVE